MPSTEDIEELINLDGGFFAGISQYRRLGWRVAIPTEEEIIAFNEENVIDYWSNFLINRYAGASCFRVNEELRKGVEEEFPLKFRAHLNSALDILPSHDNQTVWRWSNIPMEGFDFLKECVGKKVMIPHFLSTSKNKNSSYNGYFEITTCADSNGKYISEIVNKLSEQEVLFKSNTIFQINAFSQDIIQMSEIKSDTYDLVYEEDFWE